MSGCLLGVWVSRCDCICLSGSNRCLSVPLSLSSCVAVTVWLPLCLSLSGHLLRAQLQLTMTNPATSVGSSPTSKTTSRASSVTPSARVTPDTRPLSASTRREGFVPRTRLLGTAPLLPACLPLACLMPRTRLLAVAFSDNMHIPTVWLLSNLSRFSLYLLLL